MGGDWFRFLAAVDNKEAGAKLMEDAVWTRDNTKSEMSRLSAKSYQSPSLPRSH